MHDFLLPFYIVELNFDVNFVNKIRAVEEIFARVPFIFVDGARVIFRNARIFLSDDGGTSFIFIAEIKCLSAA